MVQGRRRTSLVPRLHRRGCCKMVVHLYYTCVSRMAMGVSIDLSFTRVTFSLFLASFSVAFLNRPQIKSCISNTYLPLLLYPHLPLIYFTFYLFQFQQAIRHRPKTPNSMSRVPSYFEPPFLALAHSTQLSHRSIAREALSAGRTLLPLLTGRRGRGCAGHCVMRGEVDGLAWAISPAMRRSRPQSGMAACRAMDPCGGSVNCDVYSFWRIFQR